MAAQPSVTTNGTPEDENAVLATILDRHSSQQCQLILATTSVWRFPTRTSEEREQTLEFIRDRVPEVSCDTLNDFVVKNRSEVDVESAFSLGRKFIAVTVEQFREIGWQGLPTRYPGTLGVIDCSRVGFDRELTEALVYYGHQRAMRSGLGSLRYLRRAADGTWTEARRVRAWIS